MLYEVITDGRALYPSGRGPAYLELRLSRRSLYRRQDLPYGYVITSYSIHYTKLYEVDYSKPLSDETRFALVEKAYQEYQDFIAEIYTRYATRKELQLQAISDRVKELCDFIKANKRFVLRIQPSQENRDKNYLVVHAMRSTVYALVIALQMKFPIHKLIELGVATILHEIGMIRLPPQLYMGNKALSPPEKNAILTHPVISYNILREFSFPLNICLGVLEHHERENGEGYPRKLTKEKISLYAKIIAVACSYEAVTAPRPYKEARDAYTGIIDIMKNQGKQYDETVIRALLFSLSLYPIGLYVLLSNDKVGQVTDVNPENPRYPIVQLVDRAARPLRRRRPRDGQPLASGDDPARGRPCARRRWHRPRP